jgi:hypothetical protein
VRGERYKSAHKNCSLHVGPALSQRLCTRNTVRKSRARPILPAVPSRPSSPGASAATCARCGWGCGVAHSRTCPPRSQKVTWHFKIAIRPTVHSDGGSTAVQRQTQRRATHCSCRSSAESGLVILLWSASGRVSEQQNDTRAPASGLIAHLQEQSFHLLQKGLRRTGAHQKNRYSLEVRNNTHKLTVLPAWSSPMISI